MEAGIGYASAAAIVVIEHVAFVNKKQNNRMEGIEEGVLELITRVLLGEREVQELQISNWDLVEHLEREGERTVGTLHTLLNSLVDMVGLLQGMLHG